MTEDRVIGVGRLETRVPDESPTRPALSEGRILMERLPHQTENMYDSGLDQGEQKPTQKASQTETLSFSKKEERAGKGRVLPAETGDREDLLSKFYAFILSSLGGILLVSRRREEKEKN